MAQPIPLNVPARDPRAELQTRLENAPLRHAAALLDAYEVLQGLHDRGVFELLRGAFGSSDKVLSILVDEAKTQKPLTLWQLFKKMCNHDTRRALSATVGLLESFGKNLGF